MGISIYVGWRVNSTSNFILNGQILNTTPCNNNINPMKFDKVKFEEDKVYKDFV